MSSGIDDLFVSLTKNMLGVESTKDASKRAQAEATMAMAHQVRDTGIVSQIEKIQQKIDAIQFKEDGTRRSNEDLQAFATVLAAYNRMLERLTAPTKRTLV